MYNFIKPYLTIFIPVITVPIIMRLIIAPIILFILKRKHIKRITSTINEGWIDDRDLQAIEYLQKEAWKGVSTPFVISYNINFLQTQIKTIFINITKIYFDENKSEINLQFSIQKVMESFYLFFEDIHKDLKKITIYRFLEKLPLNLFLRVTKINKSIRIFTQNRIIQILHKYRISTKVIRLILIPILGFPIIITQLIFSLLYTTLFEGYIRFIYSLILIKFGYYTIYLYSDRNSSLHKKLNFCHKEIIEKGKIIEERHTKFKNRYIYSDKLNPALDKLKEELLTENLMYSRETSETNSSFDRIFKRLNNTIKNTIESELNNKSTNISPEKLLKIATTICKVYFPNSENPIFSLRVKEIIELGYFATTLSLKTIYTVPASKHILDRIPLKLVININDFITDERVKKILPEIKKGNRILKNVQGFYWTSRVLTRRSNPVVFIASMVTPVFYQQILDIIKENIYNYTGLLIIDSCESTVLKNKNCRICNIFK